MVTCIMMMFSCLRLNWNKQGGKNAAKGTNSAICTVRPHYLLRLSAKASLQQGFPLDDII